MTVSVDGLNVYYSSPEEKDKPERSTYSKLEDVTIFPPKAETPKKDREKLQKMFDICNEKACNILNEEMQTNPFVKIEYGQKENKTEDMNRLIEEELERQEQQVFKDWECTNLGVLQGATQADWIDFIGNSMKRGKIISYKHKDFPKYTQEVINKEVENRVVSEALFGKKENSGKIDYSEIDFDILDLMANRFNTNKHKYPHGNMLKPIEEKELLFALFRHLKKMIQPVDNDPETFEEHLSAILCNAQMVYQQRKLNKN